MNAQNDLLYIQNLSPMAWVSEILREWGILSWHIVGFDIEKSEISKRQLYTDRTTIEIMPHHYINLPKEWLRRNTVYDCFIGAEKNPRFRFRIGNNEKIESISPNKITKQSRDEHFVHQDEAEQPIKTKWAIYQPKQIHIRESEQQTIGNREGIMHWVKKVVEKLPSRKK